MYVTAVSPGLLVGLTVTKEVASGSSIGFWYPIPYHGPPCPALIQGDGFLTLLQIEMPHFVDIHGKPALF